LPDQLHQLVVIDLIKEGFEVDVDYPALSRLDVFLCRPYRVMRAPARSESVTVGAETFFENRAQYLVDRLLDKSVQYRGYSQRPLASIGFGYLNGPDRCRLVFACP
jgi:hypothetical protein